MGNHSTDLRLSVAGQYFEHLHGHLGQAFIFFIGQRWDNPADLVCQFDADLRVRVFRQHNVGL